MRIGFTEEMKGFYTFGAPAYDAGYVTGQRDWNRLSFRLTIATDDLDAVFADPEHRMRAEGFLRCRALGAGDMPVHGGTFDLFATGRSPGRLMMRYRLPVESNRGPLTLLGYKDVGNDGGLDAWRDTTTLFTRLVPGADVGFDHPEDDTYARGILRLNTLMFGRQLTTFRGSPLALARFGTFFAARLIEVYGHHANMEVPA